MSHPPPPPFLRPVAGLLLVGLAAGCGGIAIDAFGRNDASTVADGGGGALDAATAPDAVVSVDGGPPADLGSLPDRVPAPTDRPTTPPVDAGPAFCPAATCVVGMRCCEALRQCIPGGALCPGDAPDGGVILDAGPGACVSARDCGEGSECVFPDSVCARSGACMARIACLRPETFCSCTGVTYSGCRPDRPTAARGPCGTPVDAGVDAGPPTCTSNAQCGAGSWCAGDGCGTRGVCQPLGDTCPGDYSPVCGCDGRTYSNDCAANYFAGVRVSSRGACPGADAGAADSGVSACLTDADCRSGNECVYPTTACARSGYCLPAIRCFVPSPFCSCTGETYLGCTPDRPTAAEGECASTPDSGTSFCATVRCTSTTFCCESARACIPLGTTCPGSGPVGCASNADCGARQWCSGSGCATTGTCAPLADACPTIYSPVCGCDRRTYGNECLAGAAGVRVAARGACP